MRAIIVNPASASGRTASRWRRIVASLESNGEAFEVLLTTAPGDAMSLARRAVAEGIVGLVVLGGDGTLGEVVAGCLKPDGSGPLADGIDLSVIHQGTGGDLARGLEIPKDEDSAIAVALGSTRRRIDVGVARFSSHPDVEAIADVDDGELVRGFVSTACVGMAAEVVERVTGRLKKLGNNGAFAAATVTCLARNRPRPVQLSTREGLDATIDVVDVDICNNRYFGGGMLVAPDARIDDGVFDVVVIRAAGRMKLIRAFPKIYSGRHLHDPLVRVERTNELHVGIPAGASAEGLVLDGELVGQTPASFQVLPGAICVRVPPGDHTL